MNNTVKVRGDELMLFLDGKSIALATNHTLAVTANMVQTTSKASGGKFVSQVPQSLSWMATTDNLYSVDEAIKLMQLWTEGTEVDIILARKSSDNRSLDDEPQPYWMPSGKMLKGKAYIQSIDINAPSGEISSYSCTFAGTGQLQIIDN